MTSWYPDERTPRTGGRRPAPPRQQRARAATARRPGPYTSATRYGGSSHRRPPASFWRPGRPRRRLVVLFLVLALVLACIVARVALLQTVESSNYASAGEAQRLFDVTLPADRGIIFDRDGYDLAVSVPATTLWADPRAVVDPAATAAALAGALGLKGNDVTALQSRLTSGKDFVYVQRQVDDDTAKKVAALKLKGIFSYSEPKRYLPAGAVGASVIGKTDVDGNGSAGLEKVYDATLTGTPGKLIRERDAQGRSIPSGENKTVAPTPGSDLVLTLDKTLQYTTEQLLMAKVDELHAKGGQVVVLDTKTGDVLASASVDTDPASGKARVAPADRVDVDVYEPGSVMKIVPSAAALNEGTATPNKYWAISAQHKSYDAVIEDAESHGNIDLNTTDIIVHSSNIGAVMLAQSLGPAGNARASSQKLEQYLRSFGFGAPTGLNLPGESPGLLPTEDLWSGTQRDTIAYGQGIGATSMQIAAAMNVIANGGTYVAPRLVEATVDGQGQRHDADPSATHQVVRPEIAQEMTTILEQVWCRGTAEQAPPVTGYTIAGKTGTGYKAQNPAYPTFINGKPGFDGYKDAQGVRHYYASFAGYLPAENPQITILASIDDPPAAGLHYGGDTAAMLWSSVAKEAVQQLRIPPSPNGGACPPGRVGG